jgi:ABC-type multidrug transport system, ATPase component
MNVGVADSQANGAKKMSEIISVRDLHVSYGSFVAVDGVSLDIAEGECFGLLGPNGAGKTTLLSCIEGIKRFKQGDITIHGLSVQRDVIKTKRLLGVQLQDATLFPDLNTIEIVQFYGALYGYFPSRSEVIALLKRFNLEEKLKAKVGELSGGQQQRLTLALSIVHKPAIVLLDEPTTGLDPQARRQVWSMIRSLRNEGKTILLTTHYMEEAEVLCQRVGVIDRGKILALDTPQNLIAQLGDVSTMIVTMMLSEEQVKTMKEQPFIQSLYYDEGLVSLQTSEPQRVEALLAELGAEDGQRPQDITIRKPDLEDVFLSLTGRALRVEKSAAS